MNTKLFVGNLAYSVTETQLKKFIDQHVSVASAKVIYDKVTGRSRGYGFVEMHSEEEARRAIESLNGASLEGRTLIINEAHQKTRPSASAHPEFVPFERSTRHSPTAVLHRHPRTK
jgi:RNA recognition motif-containing protein